MNKVKCLLVASPLHFTASSFATHSSSPYWEFSFLGGIATLNQEEISLTFREGLPADSLVQDNEDSWASWTLAAGIGYAIPLNTTSKNELKWLPLIQPQMNVYFLDGDMQGILHQFAALPGEGFQTDYTISLESTRVMFDLALTLISWKNFSIYAMAGLGPSWNRVGFHSNEYECLLARKINTQIDSNFASEFGGGVNYALTDSLSLSAQYLYTSLYAVQLASEGESDGTVISNIISDSFDIHSQTILAGLRFAF